MKEVAILLSCGVDCRSATFLAKLLFSSLEDSVKMRRVASLTRRDSWRSLVRRISRSLELSRLWETRSDETSWRESLVIDLSRLSDSRRDSRISRLVSLGEVLS